MYRERRWQRQKTPSKLHYLDLKTNQTLSFDRKTEGRLEKLTEASISLAEISETSVGLRVNYKGVKYEKRLETGENMTLPGIASIHNYGNRSHGNRAHLRIKISQRYRFKKS